MVKSFLYLMSLAPLSYLLLWLSYYPLMPGWYLTTSRTYIYIHIHISIYICVFFFHSFLAIKHSLQFLKLITQKETNLSLKEACGYCINMNKC